MLPPLEGPHPRPGAARRRREPKRRRKLRRPSLADLKYPITEIHYYLRSRRGEKPNPKLPPVPKLAQAKVTLGQTSVGYSAPKTTKKAKNYNGAIADLDDDEGKIYNGDALQAIYTAIFNEMNRRGFYGVLVLPDSADIDATTGEDLRAGRKNSKWTSIPARSGKFAPSPSR